MIEPELPVDALPVDARVPTTSVALTWSPLYLRVSMTPLIVIEVVASSSTLPPSV